MTSRKGGPKTAEGKATAAANATKHGIMALAVPASERGGYSLHLANVLESLAPVGYMEQQLAERVALTMWRLRRLDVWESTLIERSRDKAAREIAADHYADRPAPYDLPVSMMNAGEVRLAIKALKLCDEQARPDDPATMRETAEEFTSAARGLLDLKKQGADAKPGAFRELTDAAIWAFAYRLIDAMRAAGVDDAVMLAAIGDDQPDDDLDCHDPWTPADLAALWRLAAGTPGLDSPGWIARQEGFERQHVGERLLMLADRAEALMSQGAGLALMPTEDDQAKIQRYDSHLERSLYKALHELEALQERRRGGVTPLARVEVHGA